MESSEAAARRMSRMASHLAATPQNSCSSSLSSMVCSSSAGMQSGSRKDSRLLFARQEHHFPNYLKDSSHCQQVPNVSPVSYGNARKDNRLMFARQGSHTQEFYMRECIEYQVSFPSEKEDAPCKQYQPNVEEPDEACIARKSSSEFNNLKDSSFDLDAEPLFARTKSEGDARQEAVVATTKPMPSMNAQHNEVDWLPRMDIAESGASYVVTVELPGVQVNGIRVEVNEERLLVSGSRPRECWIDSTKQNEKAFYHRKELCQGPFRVQWPMPRSINLDGVSAECMDGFLRIFLPKREH